jgi:hypothetical protein
VLRLTFAGDLDDAVIDRMDEAIHFDLPGREQRGKLLALYLDKYISKAGTEQVRQQQQQACGCGLRLSSPASVPASCGGWQAAGPRADPCDVLWSLCF